MDVSIRLGLKKQRLLALLPIICSQAKKLGAQGCPWAIPVNWMERWETLIQNQVQADPMDSKTVALGHLIRYWPWTNEQIGLLLVDILNGAVLPSGVLQPGKGVGTLVFHVHDLNHWFASKQRVPHARNERLAGQKGHHLLRVLHVTLHAQGERLNALQN